RDLHDERGLSPGHIDTVRLSRSIADAAAWFEAHEPQRLEDLRHHIERYRATLAAYAIKDQAVRERLGRRPARQRLRRGWTAAVGFPVFVYGLITSGLPYIVPRWIARRSATKETNYATTRLLAGMVAFPLFWGAETWIVWRLAGFAWAIVCLSTLPASTRPACPSLPGTGRATARMRFGLLALTRPQTAPRLLAEPRQLVAFLDRARDDYLAATKGSSF